MAQDTPLVISISPTGTQIQIEREGNTFTKEVVLKELAGKINPSLAEDSEMLPPNCRQRIKIGNNILLMIEVPSGKRTLNVVEGNAIKKIKDVAMPAALFAISLIKSPEGFKQNHAHIFALENDRIIFTKDKLYNYPSPNVYGVGDANESTVCWGRETALPPLKALAAAEGLVKGFFTNAFNGDLFKTDRTSVRFPWDKIENVAKVDQYFSLLAAEGKFRNEWLAPASTKFKTFADAIDTIKSTFH